MTIDRLMKGPVQIGGMHWLCSASTFYKCSSPQSSKYSQSIRNWSLFYTSSSINCHFDQFDYCHFLGTSWIGWRQLFATTYFIKTNSDQQVLSNQKKLLKRVPSKKNECGDASVYFLGPCLKISVRSLAVEECQWFKIVFFRKMVFKLGTLKTVVNAVSPKPLIKYSYERLLKKI